MDDSSTYCNLLVSEQDKGLSLKKIMAFLFLALILTGCTTKSKNVVEKDDSNDILEVYYRLIDGIKYRNFEKILSCYADDATYSYGQNTGEKYICFNNTKNIRGIDNIRLQYGYLFKRNILDKIEFEIIKVDANKSDPNIKFLNVWQNSDDDVIEIIEFKKIQDKYFISGHRILKKES
jgi:hypothetical protein